MEQSIEVFVGIDVLKTRNSIAIADDGSDGEVRFLGEVDASPEAMRRVIQWIAAPACASALLLRSHRPAPARRSDARGDQNAAPAASALAGSPSLLAREDARDHRFSHRRR